jgi:hypothetical protein
MRTPYAMRASFSGRGVAGHSLFSLSAADNAEYASQCVQRWKRRLLSEAGVGVAEVMMLAPDVVGPSAARLHVLIEDRGVLEMDVPMMPVTNLGPVTEVDLATCVVRPLTFGTLTLSTGDGSPKVNGKEVVLFEKEGQSSMYAIRVPLDVSRRGPVGKYVIDDPEEPMWASIARHQVPVVEVRADESTVVALNLPPMIPIDLELQAASGRSVGYARVALFSSHRKAPAILQWGAKERVRLRMPIGECRADVLGSGFRASSEVRNIGDGVSAWVIRLQEDS